MRCLPVVLGFVAGSSLGMAPARAHIQITSHQQRYAMDEIKDAPCGLPGGGPGPLRYRFAPGATITLEWSEYVAHPGHYRISFDADGDDDFVDPAGPDDVDTNPAVLIDAIPDESGAGSYTQSVKLPDITCDNCTLQLIQVMTDKQGNGWGNDDIYYTCVDLRLGEGDDDDAGSETQHADGESDGGAGSGETGCGCLETPSSTSSPLILALLVLGRHRRRGPRTEPGEPR